MVLKLTASRRQFGLDIRPAAMFRKFEQFRQSEGIVAALEFWVSGVARTKGSVDVGRHGQVLHTEASKHRAAVIKDAVEVAINSYGWKTVRAPGAVEVVHVAFLPAPLGFDDAERLAATWTNSGDLDKIDRNMFDALTEAGVWADDVQVTDLGSRKHVARDQSMVGEYVMIRTVSPMVAVSRRLADETMCRTARERVTGTAPTPVGF